jgi:hypothetical protein
VDLAKHHQTSCASAKVARIILDGKNDGRCIGKKFIHHVGPTSNFDPDPTTVKIANVQTIRAEVQEESIHVYMFQLEMERKRQARENNIRAISLSASTFRANS